MALELNVDSLKAAKFRGPVAFYDYAKGGARQDFECVDEPRFGYFWERKTRKDQGRQSYMVDGAEVPSLEKACELLASPPDPNSPREVHKRWHEEFEASPQLEHGPYRALSEARVNADGGAFGMVRASMQRVDGGWHGGINSYADKERAAGRDWPGWLYDVKSGAHESYRLMYLFQADAEKDTHLTCALGTKCRECPILKAIETAVIEARAGKFASYSNEQDLLMVKTWTCIGHILHAGARPHDGAFLSRPGDHDF